MSSTTFHQFRGIGLTRGPSLLGRAIFNPLLRNPQESRTEPTGHWILRTLTQLPKQIIFRFSERASLGKEKGDEIVYCTTRCIKTLDLRLDDIINMFSLLLFVEQTLHLLSSTYAAVKYECQGFFFFYFHYRLVNFK